VDAQLQQAEASLDGLQLIPEASSTSAAIQTASDKTSSSPTATPSDGNRSCSLIDLETFQKMRLNNLSNRSAHWDPKVFRKIAQLIDPPKSPVESPPNSASTTRPNSPPDAKSLASKSRRVAQCHLLITILASLSTADMDDLTHLLPALQAMSGDSNILHSKMVSLSEIVCCLNAFLDCSTLCIRRENQQRRSWKRAWLF